jgi:hypothetical protein
MHNEDQKAGMLRKRGGRMRNWSNRYVMLNGSKLSYKVKSDSTNIRASFDLAPGCIVTEVLEDTMGSMGIKGKRLFSFWIVWPHDKHGKPINEKNLHQSADSDDDEHKGLEDKKHKDLKHIIQNEMTHKKDLKQIVQSEMMEQRLQQEKMEGAIERHHKYDHTVAIGKG